MRLSIRRGATIMDQHPVGLRSDGAFAKEVICRPSGGVHKLISGMTGSGKAVKTDTPIPTPTGWTTMGELQVGDRVFGADGVPCTVTSAFDVMYDRPCYDMFFSDGSVITADGGHLWLTDDASTRRSREQQRRFDHTRTRRPLINPDRHPHLRQLIHDNPTVVTVPQAAAAAGIHLTSPAIYRIARELQPLGRIRDTQVPMRYRERIIHKPGKWVSLYSTQDLVGGLIDAGTRPINDQRDRRSGSRVRTTEDIARTLRGNDGRANHSIPLTGPIVCPTVDLPMDPYLLGAWLAEGTTGSGVMTLNRDDAQDIINSIERAGWETRLVPSQDRPGSVGVRVVGLTTVLRAVGVLEDKHVPPVYLRASIAQRKALLAGLIDTDGTVAPQGSTQFDSTLHGLATAVRELAVSLGYRPTIISKTARLNGLDYGTVWRVSWTTSDCLFTVTRKSSTLRDRTGRAAAHRTNCRYITDVRPVPSVPVRCISVDSPGHLFLAGPTMIPTHNSFGEKPTLLTGAALQADQIIIDTVKGLQSYASVAGALQIYETDPGRARQYLKRLVTHVLPARTNHLTREGLTEWDPKRSQLRFLIVHIEEAWQLANASSLVGLGNAIRSAGGRLVISLQQPTFDQMPTVLRNQMGAYRAYGLADRDYNEFSLPEDVIKAGANPAQWGNEDPGMHYCVMPGQTIKEKVMEVRSFTDGTGENSFANAAAYVASRLGPMCPVTAAALGELWTTNVAPLELVKRMGPIVPGPLTVVALTELDEVTDVTGVGERPAELPPEDDEDDFESRWDVSEFEDDEDEDDFTITETDDNVTITGTNGEEFTIDFDYEDDPDSEIADPDEPMHPVLARMIGDPPKDGITPDEFQELVTTIVDEFLASDEPRLTRKSLINPAGDSGWKIQTFYKYLNKDPRITKAERHAGGGWVRVGTTAVAA